MSGPLLPLGHLTLPFSHRAVAALALSPQLAEAQPETLQQTVQTLSQQCRVRNLYGKCKKKNGKTNGRRKSNIDLDPSFSLIISASECRVLFVAAEFDACQRNSKLQPASYQ